MRKFGITTGKLLIYFLGWILLVSIIPVPNNENPAIWRFWAEVIPFLCIVGISFLFWLIEKKEIPVFPISNPVKSCLIGITGGMIWLGLTCLILFLLGVFKIESSHAVPMLWLWILSVFINAIMQEILVRGYLYQMLKERYHILPAVIVSTALFTLLHGGAFEAGVIPVFNVLTMSLLMTVVLEYTQSLIAPILMHFLWNGVGAVILGGVSLAEDYPHIYTAVFSGNTWLSGGIYKIEGSIVVSLLNVILIVIFLVLCKRQHAASW